MWAQRIGNFDEFEELLQSGLYEGVSQNGCGPSGSSKLCEFILGSYISAMTQGVDGHCGMGEKITGDGRLSHEDRDLLHHVKGGVPGMMTGFRVERRQ